MRGMQLWEKGGAVVIISALFFITAFLLPAYEEGKCGGKEEAKEKSGTISGVVNHATVKKYSAVVFIEEMAGRTFAAPEKHPLMDQVGKVFIPRIIPVVVGTTVDFMNSDELEHNVFSPDNEKYDLGNWGKGEKRSYVFSRAGAYTQLCSLHPEMIAYVVACKTPYFAVTDAEGKFKMNDVPVGSWKLKVWNERFKQKQLEKTFDVTVEQGGEAKCVIEP